MLYTIDAYSDIGIRKKVNQDSLIIKQARTSNMGRVCFACLCDGMGGLSQGEIASASFVNRMGKWFENDFPHLIMSQDTTEDLSQQSTTGNSQQGDYWRQIEVQWGLIARQMNQGLKQYGADNGIRLGTTAVAMILIGNEYLVMSVGDSRAYQFNKRHIKQITHDQSYVQQQMDLGRMTPEEAAASSQKSVLLQCIGASENVFPDFFRGTFEKKNYFLLCSDGLWRLLKPEEIISIAPQKDGVKKLTELALKRGETDNISGLVIGAK
ncbi:Serine/threonine protein phosphatase PrpC [Pseudobutyrivibrio sp. YE44]|uniref:PP2C family protein-serine/threonine phosphatase n=1 Tax=Pseudobutyrivibrio sp. YE44 TaxID=1520802 RepID=UPI00088263C9|nr:protein phosphatase 2C domain-containing protein [Pseudobutyrivibrio sp. YE44]SDB40009.1 Serine/threonine protein phosphatase PrpC [Pseudobutyrivibrio sp. YE44]